MGDPDFIPPHVNHLEPLSSQSRESNSKSLQANLKQFLYEFWLFTWKEAQACLFAGSFFLILFASNHIPLLGLARYDFLFLAAIGIQLIFLALRLESWEEIKVIFLFHIVGFALELFKTAPGIGSWSYPEAGFLKIGAVPLYSGFMYSAVGSYINQAWKIFRLRYSNFPPLPLLIVLSVAIYLNFFTHHFAPDFRWWLIGFVFLLFAGTTVHFTMDQKPRQMPLFVSLILIGFFIWVAENISTFFGAWKYPDQLYKWAMVSPQKISSWFLLVIVSFNIVAFLHRKGLKAA